MCARVYVCSHNSLHPPPPPQRRRFPLPVLCGVSSGPNGKRSRRQCCPHKYAKIRVCVYGWSPRGQSLGGTVRAYTRTRTRTKAYRRPETWFGNRAYRNASGQRYAMNVPPSPKLRDLVKADVSTGCTGRHWVRIYSAVKQLQCTDRFAHAFQLVRRHFPMQQMLRVLDTK